MRASIVTIAYVQPTPCSTRAKVCTSMLAAAPNRAVEPAKTSMPTLYTMRRPQCVHATAASGEASMTANGNAANEAEIAGLDASVGP